MVFTVVGAMMATLFGAGSVSRALDVSDGNGWLWSSQNSSTQRINMRSGDVDMRFMLKDAQGHDVAVVQTDAHLLLHDRSAGTVTSIDLSDLGVKATLGVPPGESTSVAMWKDVVLLVDGPSGVVRRLDPDNLGTKGEPLRLSPGLVTGAFDVEGRYWVASPADGTVLAVTAEPGSMRLRIQQTVRVAEPKHELKLTVLDKGAAVIDETGDVVVVINNGQTRRVSVPGLGSTVVGQRTTGPVIAIAVPGSRQIVLIDGDQVRTIVLPGEGELGEAVLFAGRIYAVDSAAGSVLVLDTSGVVKGQISTPSSSGPVTLEQREGHLLINQPDGPTGHVVDKSHEVRTVTKYVNAGSGPQEDTLPSNGPKQKAPKPETRPIASPELSVPTAGLDLSDQDAKPNDAGDTPAPSPTAPQQPERPAPAPTPAPAPAPAPKPTPSPPQTNNAVPTGVTAVRKNSQDVTVSWNAVSIPPGSSLDRYNVYSCTKTGQSCQNLYTSKTTSVDVVKFSADAGGGAGATFKVSSIINGRESALSALSNAV